MSTWAQIAKHEEPDVSAKKNKTYPLGWVRIYRDDKNHVAFEHHENDPYLQEKEVDLNELMGKAILRMRARWEYHHYLSGTYYNYDIQDDLDDYLMPHSVHLQPPLYQGGGLHPVSNNPMHSLS